MTEVIRKCTPREAGAALAGSAGCQLVDVREFSEYDAERVAGGRLAPLSALEKGLGGPAAHTAMMEDEVVRRRPPFSRGGPQSRR